MNFEPKYQLPTDGVAIALSLSSVGRQGPSRATQEELYQLPYAGSPRLQDYVRRFRPAISVEIACPVLVDGSVETRTMNVQVRYGGALLNPGAPIENEVDEIVSSFSAPAIVLSTVSDDPEDREDARDYPLLRLALAVGAIGEVLDPNWILAEGLDVTRTDDRASLLESLTGGDCADVSPSELVLAPNNPAVVSDPALVDGAFTSLDEAAVASLYRETKIALLGTVPPNDKGYAEFLGELRLELRDALATTLSKIRQVDNELARNWVTLAMLHSAAQNAQPIRVLDVPGNWLVPADGRLTPVGGHVRMENTSAQREAFRSLVVGSDASDQACAALRFVLPEPIEDVRTLKSLGEWAAEEKVVVYVNAAATDLDGLARTADKMQNGTSEDWGKHIAVFGDWFCLSRGEDGSTLEIPAVVPAVALQTALDLRPPEGGGSVSGLAVAAAGTRHKLFEFDGQARSIAKYVSKARPRSIPALATDRTIRRATRVWLNVPVPRHDGDGYAIGTAELLYRCPKPESPERLFQNIAPVRIRNWAVRTVAYLLRHNGIGISINDKSLKELREALQAWLESLDDRKGRSFINAEKSEIAVNVQDGNRLHVDVKLVYPPVITQFSVSDYSEIDQLTSTDELEFEFDPEQRVWALSATA